MCVPSFVASAGPERKKKFSPLSSFFLPRTFLPTEYSPTGTANRQNLSFREINEESPKFQVLETAEGERGKTIPGL